MFPPPAPQPCGGWKGGIQPGVALRRRVSDPFAHPSLPGGVQPAHPLTSGENWPRGIQGMVTAQCWVPESCAGAGVTAVPPVEALHGCRCTGTLWRSRWLLWAICRHPAFGGETRSGSFRGVVCVAAHPSFCCFVLFLLLSLALYSSCNHSEKNSSCKMQTE